MYAAMSLVLQVCMTLYVDFELNTVYCKTVQRCLLLRNIGLLTPQNSIFLQAGWSYHSFFFFVLFCLFVHTSHAMHFGQLDSCFEYWCS